LCFEAQAADALLGWARSWHTEQNGAHPVIVPGLCNL